MSEEGATQLFRPLESNVLILGAIGALQFDVVAYRLQSEYNVHCIYEPINVVAARWVVSNDESALAEIKLEQHRHLAIDGSGHLTYLAPSRVNLDITTEQWPQIDFLSTREH